jgi:iron complex transport system substrate-binding protein
LLNQNDIMEQKMRNTRWTFLIAAIMAVNLGLAGCASPAAPAPAATPTPSPIVLTDGLGRTVSLPAPAQRIISLAPGNTEILFAIGAGPQVIGRDAYSDYPEAAKQVTDIGGGFGELNTEVILAQKPDLVLAGSLTPPEQLTALERLGLTVFSVANPKDFPGLFDNIRLVAQLTGRAAQADELIAGLQKRVATVQEKLGSPATRPLVFYELDGTDPNAPWTPGPGSFVDRLITLAGGENLGSQLKSEWVQVSIEELIARNPQIILIGDATWGGVTLDQVRARPGWKTMPAIQADQLFVFDDNLVSRPGPRLVDGLETMAKLLHPELFK